MEYDKKSFDVKDIFRKWIQHKIKLVLFCKITTICFQTLPLLVVLLFYLSKTKVDFVFGQHYFIHTPANKVWEGINERPCSYIYLSVGLTWYIYIDSSYLPQMLLTVWGYGVSWFWHQSHLGKFEVTGNRSAKFVSDPYPS